jgi:hypothetical protein
MMRLWGGVLVLVLALMGAAYSQDTPKLKGTLPQNYGKIGLTDVQKQSVYKIRADYRGKIEQLQKQIAKLKMEEKEALEKVLTPEQLKRLKEIRSGEKSTEKPKTTDKGKTDKAKD